MSNTLCFDPQNYQVKQHEANGKTLTYRAFEGIDYCSTPVDPIQKLNLFVPEPYYHGKQINGYSLNTAPIFAPNTAGGYMPGPAASCGKSLYGLPDSVFEALCHGYVVACAGVRGRSSQAPDGRYTGRSPALIVDMKAAIRYLRHNRDVIPGNVERIITNGTSAGGTLSALAGATGNSPDYEADLKSIGAASERDDIFAASCYCPIHNLENADAAYEWMFCGLNDYHQLHYSPEGIPSTKDGKMTEKQIALSPELKKLFPAYVNTLGITNSQGTTLTLDADGNGSFKDYVKEWVLDSIQRELDTHISRDNLSNLAVAGSNLEDQTYITVRDGKAIDFDWDEFIHTITRMKTAPAFDALDLSSPENEEFGTATIKAAHFTDFSLQHSECNGGMADTRAIKRINPLNYIGKADTARYWRIRHGSFDRDTALAIPIILAATLKNRGYDVDFHLPWGLPHSGDYDLEELFAWIDSICQKETTA